MAISAAENDRPIFILRAPRRFWGSLGSGRMLGAPPSTESPHRQQQVTRESDRADAGNCSPFESGAVTSNPSDDWAGKQARYPGCGTTVTIPRVPLDDQFRANDGPPQELPFAAEPAEFFDELFSQIETPPGTRAIPTEPAAT